MRRACLLVIQFQFPCITFAIVCHEPAERDFLRISIQIFFFFFLFFFRLTFVVVVVVFVASFFFFFFLLFSFFSFSFVGGWGVVALFARNRFEPECNVSSKHVKVQKNAVY